MVQSKTGLLFVLPIMTATLDFSISPGLLPQPVQDRAMPRASMTAASLLAAVFAASLLAVVFAASLLTDASAVLQVMTEASLVIIFFIHVSSFFKRRFCGILPGGLQVQVCPFLQRHSGRAVQRLFQMPFRLFQAGLSYLPTASLLLPEDRFQ